jgi:hypothetical protein
VNLQVILRAADTTKVSDKKYFSPKKSTIPQPRFGPYLSGIGNVIPDFERQALPVKEPGIKRAGIKKFTC